MIDSNKDTLNTVLGNLTMNREQIQKAIEAAREVVAGIDPDVEDAITLLIRKVGDVQTVGKMVGAQMQIDQLDRTKAELEVLVAAVLVILKSDNLVGRMDESLRKAG